MDVHEIIFTRRDVERSSEKIQLKIHDPRNCGWVHRECHAEAEGRIGLTRGIIYLIKYEGMRSVMKFVSEMNAELSVSRAEKGLVLNEVFEELSILLLQSELNKKWRTQSGKSR